MRGRPAGYNSTVYISVTYTKERPIGAIGAVRARVGTTECSCHALACTIRALSACH